jgi:hypothetical protein
MSGIVEEDNDGINSTNLFELDSARIETSDNVNNTNTGSPEVFIPTNSLHPTVVVKDPLIEIGLGLNFLAHPCPKRSGSGFISIVDRRYALKEERLMVLLLSKIGVLEILH